MNLRWDHFVNPYDVPRFPTSGDARDNRHVQFVRDFASHVSVLQDRQEMQVTDIEYTLKRVQVQSDAVS